MPPPPLSPSQGPYAVVDGASDAHEIALEEGEVVFTDLVQVPVPEPLGAAGAERGLCLLVAGGRDMLIGLAGGRPVGTRALASLQVDVVNAGAAAARHTPDPRCDSRYLLETLFCEGDTSLEAGGWWWWLR